MHDFHRALYHTLVLSYSIVDILICKMAVDFSSNLAFFKLHFVLRKCSSFITEYKFNLTEFFD